MDRTQQEYNRVIEHTLKLADEDNDDAVNFLSAWNEGSFDVCERVFGYVAPDWLKNHEIEEPPQAVASDLFPDIERAGCDKSECDIYTAAIDIEGHGAVIEVHGSTKQKAEARRDAIFNALTGADFKQVRFEVGNEYPTLEGKMVKMVQRDDRRGYETILGKDNVWRYNRLDNDLGRCTGSASDDKQNLIPHYVRTQPHPRPWDGRIHVGLVTLPADWRAQATRQYRHNSEDALLIGYDKTIIDRMLEHFPVYPVNKEGV